MTLFSGYTENTLKKELEHSLFEQGYGLNNGKFFLRETDRESKRKAHSLARESRIKNHIKLLESFYDKAYLYTSNYSDIEVSRIKPKIIEVSSKSRFYSNLFLWWNLVWWSLPYEKAYGRQMRFIVWDEYHNGPIGLIGLQSPILKWKARDQYLGLEKDNLDYWINQSMSAQRLGALPPYNKILGGKLIASLVTSDDIRRKFQEKYSNRRTELLSRIIPSGLLFITTTGAFGKSSIYNRLKDKRGDLLCKRIGETHGAGTFQIPGHIYEGLIEFLKYKNKFSGRYYGSGPSKRMKNIDNALKLLGYKSGAAHGVKRSVYIFELVENLFGVLHKDQEPIWKTGSADDITDYWKKRWAFNRIENMDEKDLSFNKNIYFDKVTEEIELCKKI